MTVRRRVTLWLSEILEDELEWRSFQPTAVRANSGALTEIVRRYAELVEAGVKSLAGRRSWLDWASALDRLNGTWLDDETDAGAVADVDTRMGPLNVVERLAVVDVVERAWAKAPGGPGPETLAGLGVVFGVGDQPL